VTRVLKKDGAKKNMGMLIKNILIKHPSG